MAGVVSSLSPKIQDNYLPNLFRLFMQTITVLNDPLSGKPVTKFKVQKLKHLSGTGKGKVP